LVKLQASLIMSLHCGSKMNANQIKVIKENRIAPILVGDDDLEISGYVSKKGIDFSTQKIRKLETVIKNKIKLRKFFYTAPNHLRCR